MKFNEIVTDLRGRIARGEFLPGEQLPLRAELLKEYDTSLGTIQKAVNLLQLEGFLTNGGPNGTRVAADSPHLFTVGIVVPAKPDDEEQVWDTFFQAFALAVEEYLYHGGPFKFKFYYGVERHSENSAVYRELLEDIECRRIAGTIVLHHVTLSDRMLNAVSTLPTVVFSDRVFDSPNIIPLMIDFAGIADFACRTLAAKGKKRPAVIVNTGKLMDFIPHILQKTAQNGLATAEAMIQGMCLCREALPWCEQLVKVLFAGPVKDHPDSMIVLNENFLGIVKNSLRQLGHGDILIVSHCNFPTRSVSPTGVLRVGNDNRSTLLRALDMLKVKHAANLPPVLLPVVDESQAVKTFDWHSPCFHRQMIADKCVR